MNILDKKFIVVSPGRTGSIMIARAISEQIKKPVTYNEVSVDSRIVHSHRANIIVENKNDWVLVISHRRDTFKGALSQLIANRTNEFNGYSKQLFHPKPIDLYEFDQHLKYRKLFYKSIDRSGYAKVVDLCLEDLLQYPYYLFENLGVPNIKMVIKTEVCPYGKEIVSNYAELMDHWLNYY
jgi:hypothetical protein